MPYSLTPLAVGDIGRDTVMDPYAHPPMVTWAQIEFFFPTTADLIESCPVFFVSDELVERLTAAGLSGLLFEDAGVFLGEQYKEFYGDSLPKAYRRLRPDPDATDPDAWIGNGLRLCVSDRMWEVLQQADLTDCKVEPL